MERVPEIEHFSPHLYVLKHSLSEKFGRKRSARLTFDT